ncbi:retrotransposon protein [Hordeum vulgare]|nr:retrotransposon protein [Hordeum vulgare]
MQGTPPFRSALASAVADIKQARRVEPSLLTSTPFPPLCVFSLRARMCQIQSPSESPYRPLCGSSRWMAPAGKKGKAATSVASAAATGPALMPSLISKEKDLSPVLQLVSSDTNEEGGSAMCLILAPPRSLVKTAYPFFIHNIYAGLVPPFFDFFYAILSHYQIQALHLNPNSVLLKSIFSFYCETIVAFGSRWRSSATSSACGSPPMASALHASPSSMSRVRAPT